MAKLASNAARVVQPLLQDRPGRTAGDRAVNDLDLEAWKDYPEIITDSLWMIPERDSTGVHSGDYHGNFIPQIPHQMMLRYTKKGDCVLDPFAGMGTTLIEGQRLGRHVIGIELQESISQQARARRDRAEPARLDGPRGVRRLTPPGVPREGGQAPRGDGQGKSADGRDAPAVSRHHSLLES